MYIQKSVECLRKDSTDAQCMQYLHKHLKTQSQVGFKRHGFVLEWFYSQQDT